MVLIVAALLFVTWPLAMPASGSQDAPVVSVTPASAPAGSAVAINGTCPARYAAFLNVGTAPGPPALDAWSTYEPLLVSDDGSVSTTLAIPSEALSGTWVFDLFCSSGATELSAVATVDIVATAPTP